MTVHVSDEAVVDLALGAGTASERAHAESCEACARSVREAASALELARRAEVPEPSPFYWQALRHGVRQRIAEERQETRRWGFLVPLAAAGAVLAVLFSGPTLPVKGPLAPGLAAWSALPLEEEDDGLRVLEGLALSSDELAGWNRGEGLSAYLANLTDDESRVVAETLRERGQGGES
jgi:hypothetical protein